MGTLAYFRQLYDYNSLSNQRIFAAAERLSEEQLDRPLGHSWGSIKDTLLHVMTAEWIWLQRWKGVSPNALLQPVDFPTLATIRSFWDELENDLDLFLAQQTPESLQSEVVYTNTKGVTYHLPLWQLLAHVPNHGTHHRGELAAMFAVLDVLHPEDDLLFYFLEQGGQS